jgi:hypothetical protein
MRFLDDAGEWQGKPTSYKKDNIGDQRQAKLLARRKSELEAARRTVCGMQLADWVLPWLIAKYGKNGTTTLDVYKRMWRALQRYHAEHKIKTAPQISRGFIMSYLAWRMENGAGRNQAIDEIKFMGMIVDEAILLGHCSANPIRKPGLKKNATKGKEIWTDEQYIEVEKHILKTKCHWQQCSFYFGKFQACRLRQCQVPLRCIRFDLNTIQYPDIVVKGGEAYAQPIDPRFRPILERLVENAKAQGLRVLCEIPWDASLRWRVTLDRCGFEDICHHGLRASWITRAAENRVSESEAMAFCHHKDREVHRIYKKVSVAAIAHVPAAVPFPGEPSRPLGPLASDSARASSSNAEESSSSHKASRSRARRPPSFAAAGSSKK